VELQSVMSEEITADDSVKKVIKECVGILEELAQRSQIIYELLKLVRIFDNEII
jgi:hypothetical protein